MSNAFTAGLDLSHSFPQPLRPSSSRQKHKEGDDNELSSQQQSSHQVPSNPDTNWTEESVHISEVSSGRKGVLTIEVSRAVLEWFHGVGH